MTERIEGSFPGGPTRRGPDEAPPPPLRIRRVSEIEARRSERVLGSARRKRRGRVAAGLVLAFGVAFALGLALGVASHTTPEELTAAREADRARDLKISGEVNRVLLELWKMEDLEHARNSGGIR